MMSVAEFSRLVTREVRSSFGRVTLSIKENDGGFLVSAQRTVKTDGLDMSVVRVVGDLPPGFFSEATSEDVKKFAERVERAFEFRIEDATDDLVGKHGFFMWTGEMVGGTVTTVYTERDCARVIEYKMDRPHVWGSDTYRSDSVWGRIPDNFGPLRFTVMD